MRYALLPCNGLDKAMGAVAREAALRCAAATGGEIICPVLLNNAPARYEKVLESLPLVVIDGCATRCASKLAGARGLKTERKVVIAEEAKDHSLTPEETLTPGPVGLELARSVAEMLSEETPASGAAEPSTAFEAPAEWLQVTHDKYVFRIPASGYYFTENDSWVRVSGTRARAGVSDYVQQKMTDFTYFDPPQAGQPVEQFGELGTLESAKAVLEVLSPITGTLIAVNTALVDNPGLANGDAYGSGWIAEVEMTDFGADRELLLDGAAYAAVVKKKAVQDAK